MTKEHGALPQIVAITEQTDFLARVGQSPVASEWVTVFPNPSLSKRKPASLVQAKTLGSYTALQIPLPSEFFTNKPEAGPKPVVAIVKTEPEDLVSHLIQDTNPMSEQRGRFIKQAIDVLEVAKPRILEGNLAQVALAKSFDTSTHMLSEALKATGAKKAVYTKYGWNTIKASQSQTETFISLMGDLKNPNTAYTGIEGQIQVARALSVRETKGVNLGELYGIASAFGVAEKLGWKKIALSLSTVTDFQRKINNPETFDLENYKGNSGQIRMDRELKGPNLGGMYALADAYGVVEKLEWTNLNAPVEMVDRFLKMIGDPQKPNKRYIGNFGQIQLAKEMGETNLQQIWLLGHGLADMEQLGWTYLASPYSTVEKFLLEVGNTSNPAPQYMGNKGQVELARKLGNINFNQLTYLGYGFDVFDKFGWTSLECSFKDFEKISGLLTKPDASDQLKGTRSQIMLAAKYGMAPNDLYVASQVTGKEELGWREFDQFINDKQIKALADFVDFPDKARYAGNRGQIEAAKTLGFKHLGTFYEAVKALEITEEQGWTASMPVHIEIAERFLESVEGKNGQVSKIYMGNMGQLRLAKELGGIHLSGFRQMASVLGLAKKLGWNELYLPYTVAEQALQIFESGDNSIKSNSGLEALARRLSAPVKRLYSFAATLRFNKDLGWTYTFAENYSSK